jgi:NADH:ubiquinone oxidoreductase subunit 6 (subunit J)
MPPAELLVNLVFYVLAAGAIGGAVAVAVSRNIVRSAFALLAVLFSVAALYAVMKADFIAAAQVLIYVGGILVLIIFAVMLTHRITDVKLSNDSTPGPAAFCACLCLLFSLVVVILFTAKWRRDSDVATAGADGFEVALRQYQSDGATGLAFGGTSVEESVVLVADVLQGPDPNRTLDQVAFVVSAAKAPEKTEKSEKAGEEIAAGGEKPAEAPRVWSKIVPFAGRSAPLRQTFDKLDEGEYTWTVKLLGTQKDASGARKDAEWTMPAARAQFSVRRGVTEPIARALAGPYLFAFEVVSVLLLAALVGAAFLARKEVKES